LILLYLETNLSRHNKLWGPQKVWGTIPWNAPRGHWSVHNTFQTVSYRMDWTSGTSFSNGPKWLCGTIRVVANDFAILVSDQSMTPI